MKKKCLVLLVILTVTYPFFNACKNKEFNDMNTAEEFVPGFIANDSKEITDILTKEYTLQELKSFFGEVSSNENLALGENRSEKVLSITDVHQKFPIECLRRNGYSVYKVQEGGYYYVFWVKTSNPLPGTQTFQPDQATVYFTAYISSLKKASDFDLIREGKSTAEDVSRVDPAFELSFLMSNRTPSYSLLEDGTVMEICYIWNGNLKSRSDLIVYRKKIISKEQSASLLASILPKDLLFFPETR